MILNKLELTFEETKTLLINLTAAMFYMCCYMLLKWAWFCKNQMSMSEKRKYHKVEDIHGYSFTYYLFSKKNFWSKWKRGGFCFSEKTANMYINEIK